MLIADAIFTLCIVGLFLYTAWTSYDCCAEPELPVEDDLLVAIADLRFMLEDDMSAEADAVRAALDVLEPKVVAFISAHAANAGAMVDAAADKQALVDAQARISALSAQLDAAAPVV